MPDVIDLQDQSNHEDEAYQMEEHDKYLHKGHLAVGQLAVGCTKVKVPNDAANLNMIWNAVAEAKKKWYKHGVNHTEEEYRTVCRDFQMLINNKKGELRHANKTVREQFVKIANYEERIESLEKTVKLLDDTNKDLKRSARKMDQYKEEFKTSSKRLRKIEDFVTSYDFDYHHRDTVSAEEYFDTDPDLRMFFKLED
jgi:DNA repair ATPase RecN